MRAQKLEAIKYHDPLAEVNCELRSKNISFPALHTHDFHEITLIIAGAVHHYINGEHQIVNANSAVFLRAQDTHSMRSVESGEFLYINLSFTKQTLEDLIVYLDTDCADDYLSAPMPPVIHLTPAETKSIQKKVEYFMLIPDDEPSRRKAYFRLMLVELFLKCFRNPSGESRLQPSWFNDLIQQMQQTENFVQGTSRLEELSGKNISYVSRLFKEKLDTTPTAYINDLRLRYCANKLMHSDAPIVDIAMDAGFNNLSHFYHLFKTKYHVSPSKYRSENIAKP